MTLEELNKIDVCKALLTAPAPEVVGQLVEELKRCITECDELKDFAIWMTGCGYDFASNAYFCERRDALLKEGD